MLPYRVWLQDGRVRAAVSMGWPAAASAASAAVGSMEVDWL